jgi:hypothetical protein
MQFILIFFSLVIWSTLAQAQGYKLEASKAHSQVDIYLFSEELTQFNFFAMDLTHKGSIKSGDFDQIYFDRNNFDNYAVLKFDLRYLGNPGVMQLSDTDYVCHGTYINQRPFSLFTSGLDKDVVDKICGQANIARNDVKKNHYSKSFLLYSMIMTTAQAQATCKDNTVKNISSIQNISSQFSAEGAIQKLGSCLADVLRGSAGVFKGMFDGVKSLFTTSPKELWNGLKKSVAEMKNFVLHLKDEMIKLKNSFSQLNADLILSIGCTLAGEMITSAGLSALTGAGVAMLSVKVVKTISRMGKMKHLFDRLNKLSFLGKGKLAEKVLACGLK